jgi:hypothetical protein
MVKTEPGMVPSLLAGLEIEVVRPSIARRPENLDRIADGRREQPLLLWRASLSGDNMSEPRSIIPLATDRLVPVNLAGRALDYLRL